LVIAVINGIIVIGGGIYNVIAVGICAFTAGLLFGSKK